jgi:hypothetical protein
VSGGRRKPAEEPKGDALEIRAASIVKVPIGKIRPYEKNARAHPPDQLAALQRSLREFGFALPLMVDRDGVLIKGHGTWQAARELGFAHAPVVVASWLTPEQVQAYRIADNALADLSSWDSDILRFEIADLSKTNFDIIGGLGLSLPQLGDLGFLGDGTLAPDLSPGSAPRGAGSLAESFGIAPFSVLNARAGWWQDRKRAWLALGIKSEVGRGENLLKFSETLMEPDPAKRAKRHTAVPGRGKTAADSPSHVDPHFYNKKRAWEKANKRKVSTEEFRTQFWDLRA